VHRPSTASSASGLTAENFGNHAPEVAPFCEVVSMRTVRAKHQILFLQSMADPDSASFLT
jgi:hypothetical protein